MIEMLVNRGPVVPRFAWRMLIGLSLLLAMPGIASAQDVILRTKDGAFEIRGTLIDDSDGRLTIGTVYLIFHCWSERSVSAIIEHHLQWSLWLSPTLKNSLIHFRQR